MAEKLTIKDLWLMKIDWQNTTEGRSVLSAIVNGRKLRLQFNDFPEESLCTLILEDGSEHDLDDCGKQWVIPKYQGKSR